MGSSSIKVGEKENKKIDSQKEKKNENGKFRQNDITDLSCLVYIDLETESRYKAMRRQYFFSSLSLFFAVHQESSYSCLNNGERERKKGLGGKFEKPKNRSPELTMFCFT